MSEQPERRDTKVVKCAMALFPNPFVNSVGIPCVEIPINKKDNIKLAWPINHSRVRALIAAEVFSCEDFVCFDKEVRRVIHILEGIAWMNPQEDPKGEIALDEHPMIEAIHIMLLQSDCSGSFEGSCSKLLTQLKKVARKYQLDAKSSSWPKTAAHLSRSIQDNNSYLEALGIHSEKGRRPGGERFIRLIHRPLCDDAGEAASQERSLDKSHHPKKKRRSDASDDDLSMLRRIESKGT